MEQKKSVFGPLLLIASGTVWLLIKSGNIPSANLWALTHIWPFLLIAAGLGLILRSYWKYTSLVFDVLIVGGLVLAIVYAPKFGWANPSMIFWGDNNAMYFGPGESGSGHVITQTREIAGFQTIKMDYPAQVFIRQGETELVRIQAEDNLLPNLKTEVKNGTLDIFYKKTNDKHVNPTEPVIITITVRDLRAVEFSSAGELTVDGLKTGNLDVALNGAGKLELNNIVVKSLTVNLSGAGSMSASGTADDLNVNISGFGGFDGAELHGKTANLNISGAGSATVWVDDQLDAEISGAGSVNYYGTAKATRQINGVGGVNHLEDK